MKDDDLARIPLKDNPLILIFDRPSSPGNLGTLIRSSDALGVDGIMITGHAVDLYDPEVIVHQQVHSLRYLSYGSHRITT